MLFPMSYLQTCVLKNHNEGGGKKNRCGLPERRKMSGNGIKRVYQWFTVGGAGEKANNPVLVKDKVLPSTWDSGWIWAFSLLQWRQENFFPSSHVLYKDRMKKLFDKSSWEHFQAGAPASSQEEQGSRADRAERVKGCVKHSCQWASSLRLLFCTATSGIKRHPWEHPEKQMPHP